MSEHSLFRNVDKETLEKVLEQADELAVPHGETVYDRQRFRRCLGILLAGELHVRRETLMVSTLKAGDVFGAAALFNEQEEYPTTLYAQGDCRLLLLNEEMVRSLIRTCPAFAENYVVYLSGRIRFLSARLDAVSADRGEGKLARYLLTLPAEDIKLSATQLCQIIGVGRATLYRAFETLERDGAIAREGKIIHTLNREKLRSCCERV